MHKPTENERFLIGAIRKGVIDAMETPLYDSWEVVMSVIGGSKYVSPADYIDDAKYADEVEEVQDELIQKIWSQLTTAAHDAIRDTKIVLE